MARGNPNWIRKKLGFENSNQETSTESEPIKAVESTKSVESTELASTSISATSQSSPLVLVSETDAYIHERMKSNPQSLDEVSVEVVKDWEEMGHVLKLPKELEPYCKEYAFRWINKKKRAIDRAIDVIGWSFVNRVLFKDVPKHLFTANGSIERGDAILAFMPAKRAEVIRLRPAEISRERVRTTPVQDLRRWENRGEKYYKPDLGAAENDDEKPVGIVVTPDNAQTEQ